MLIAIIAIIGGIATLAWAADQFVIGASNVALIKRVSPLVVGVVIIGFGTSAPELIVSAIAAADGEADVAIGNVVGSNIANLSLLLGLGAVFVPLAVASGTVQREAPIVAAAVAAFAIAVQGGGINRIEGVLLLVAMAGALVVVARRSPGDPLETETVDFAHPSDHTLPREVGRTIIGLIGTIGAAQILLWGALEVADRASLSKGFVGVTMVAVGTSLPELVTVIQSARRGATDLIVGNLLGSNLFNSLAVGGVVGLIGAPSINDTSLTMVGAGTAVAISLVAWVAMHTGHEVGRREGAALVVLYLLFLPLVA